MNCEELIATLERADGPSREVDAGIAILLAPKTFFGKEVREWYATSGCRWLNCETVDGYLHSQAAPVPKFTASIDAALTLVPEGVEWELTTIYGEARAEVGLNNTNGMHETGRRKDGNIPIALCIAALKARGDA